MEIVLDWNGPLIVPQRLPHSQTYVDSLRGRGVYLWYREYPNGDLVAYVGKTNDVASRFEQWLVAILSMHCRVRTPDGGILGDYSQLGFFQRIMDLDESMEVAKSEVRLTRFHYAFTTDIGNAEGYLIARLLVRAPTTISSHRPIVFGQNQPPFDRSTVVVNSFSRLEEPAAQCGNLEYILGI